MANKDIYNAVNETIKDLHNKINEIKSIPDNGSDKIVSIKNKTIEVLNNVLAKLDTTNEHEMDFEEMVKGLETVSNKSRQLYENALIKIKQINEELINSKIVSYNVVNDELSNEAINILKEWLMPEGE